MSSYDRLGRVPEGGSTFAPRMRRGESGRRLRRLALRTVGLVIAGSLAVALASVAWSYFGGEGSGSAPFSVDVAAGANCDPAILTTSAAATTLAASDPATASSTYNGSTCALDFLFGIPRGPQGDPGVAGAAGAAGADGQDGAQGLAGADGAPGAQGATGPAGADGVSVTSSSLGSAAGGCSTSVGGVFGSSFSSASGTTYACTGPQGPQGVQGSQGVTGSTGSTGSQGPAGPAGAAGVSAREVVSSFFAASGSGNVGTVASCPAGKVLLGGGGAVTDASGNLQTASSGFQLIGSAPTSDSDWSVRGLKTTSGGSWGVKAWAICAVVAP